jgi:osmoprotectant transport system ATP-binding protein
MLSERLFERIDEVDIEKASKSYGKVKALDRVDLSIMGGELLVLIGPSGSGKTTALRAINRLSELDSGKISINGKDVRNFDPVLLRRNIGYVIQQIGLFPHMTVRENIELILRLDGVEKKAREEQVDKLLELVSLPAAEFAGRYPKQLSGGQRQRVGLARALATDPYLILMDEPFGALDPILRRQLQEEFLKIKKKLDKTIVFVTHDIEEALKLGDRIAIMDKGRIVQLGAPDGILKKPKNDFVRKIVRPERFRDGMV